MTKEQIPSVLEAVPSWPEEDRQEHAEYARDIQARRRTGVYVMSDEERTAVRRGLAEADRGDFVPDDAVAEADKRWGLGS